MDLAVLVHIIVVIALIGLLVWGITSLFKMPAQYAQMIYVVSVIGLVIYILRVTGLFKV